MPGETTQQAQQSNEALNQEAQQGAEQNSRFSSDDFFDPRSAITNEEDDYESVIADPINFDQQEEKKPEENKPDNIKKNDQNSDDPFDLEGIDFDGDQDNEEGEGEKSKADSNSSLSKEQMIEALKKEGYSIAKEDPENQNAERTGKLEILNERISMIDNFLSQPNDVVVKEHIKGEILKTYRSEGRGENFDKEDLQLEIDAQYDEISSSPAMLKMYADNVRRDVQEMRQKVDGEKETISNEIDTERQSSIDQNRNKLKTSLSSFVKEGFYSVPTTADEVKEVYKEITSGEFTEKINSNPELVAKFGLFLKKENQISEALGKPTYGQGVKAAFDNINGQSKSGQSSVANAMASRSSGGQEVSDTFNSRFESNEVAPEAEQKTKHVAGRGIMY